MQVLVSAAYLVQVVCVVVVVTPCLAHREHKVHNIVLYPDKQSWCKTTAIKQVVTSPGYQPVTIDNNVCVGACFSYSIPHTQPAEPGEFITPYCDSCQPVDTMCYHVTLHAEDDNTESASSIQKRVQIINNCTCLSCNKNQDPDCGDLTEGRTDELPLDLLSDKETLQDQPENPGFPSFSSFTTPTQTTDEIPELLLFMPNKTSRSESHLSGVTNPNATTKEQKFELNSKLITLLKSLQEQDEEDAPNLNFDRQQLSELLGIIEGSEHKLSDKNLMDFVNFVNIHNSENLQLDLSKLKELLTDFQRTQDLVEQHRHFGLGDKDQSGGNSLEENLKRPPLPIAHEKHYVGEKQQLAGHISHLIRGPHGSLVSREDGPPQQLLSGGIREKIHVDPDMLKPNHVGTVIRYENHHRAASSEEDDN